MLEIIHFDCGKWEQNVDEADSIKRKSPTVQQRHSILRVLRGTNNLEMLVLVIMDRSDGSQPCRTGR